MIASSAGAIQDESDYYPYGGELIVSNGDPNNYKFTGKERDSESNLDNFGARYLTSSLGRFMTPDWAARPTTVPYAVFGDPQSLNLYGYVRNDPISQADADGHACISSQSTTCPQSDWKDYYGCALKTCGPYSEENTLSGPSQNTSWLQKLKNFLFSDPCGTNTNCVTVYASPDTGPVERAWLTATAPIQKAADWVDRHPLLVFPVAVAAAFKGDEGPIETDELTAEEYISKYLKGGINSVFPSEFKQSTIKFTQAAAKSGDRAARSAMKLLTKGEYQK